MSRKYALAIHGGAGTLLRSEITPEQEKEYTNALKDALIIGEEVLQQGGTALDAVEAAVISLEDCPLFNAGKGSVFTHEGNHEMEASIMDGSNLQAGAVAGVSQIKNPIALSKLILKDEDFVYLAGDGAEAFATEHGMGLVPNDYFYSEFRYKQLLAAREGNKTVLDHDGERKFGTVGAVAYDQHGNLAAATSTGGLTNKKYGRIGDSSLIGSGCYAENGVSAVSATGYGEYFIRAVVAHDIAALVKYKGVSLQEAADEVVQKKLREMQGEGGVIAVGAHGEISISFNSEGMYRAWVDSDEGNHHVAIFK